ncbi:MAG: DUF3450 domain-containing protein [Rhodobacteraceae bacterium]|nr:DUF3450 domain-containing protein [Planctomycetales bacterium]MCB2106603.1 DUF3450 domain-containing protein [Paracoccaceae bacterium]
MRRFSNKRFELLAGVALAAALALSTPASAQVQQLKEQIIAQAQENQQSQDRINKLDDETGAIESEYKGVLQQLDSLNVYNNQLQSLINSQNAEMTAIEKDILRVTTIDREVVPLMLRMVEGLKQFVDLDVPFLIEERTQRVANLQKLMTRADATPAEKFRRVLEAYQIENDYGRTIEGYTGEVTTDDGRKLSVDFLRMGRVALYYKTLDDQLLARWNQKDRRWEALDTGYVSNVKAALAIARQQVAPDLVVLPIDAPENAK